ncbi:MAG: 3-demethylubiquinone-9 3-methyltransferase, partial [uncultured Ramlibacter sp.]
GQQEHHLPLVRRHRPGGRPVLREDLPGQQGRRHPPCARRLPFRQAGRRADGRVHCRRHPLRGPERRPCVQAQRGFLVPDRHRRPGRDRSPVERHHRQRRPGQRLRLVQGQVGPVVADHAAGPHRSDRGSRSGGGQARLRRDDGDDQDRRR